MSTPHDRAVLSAMLNPLMPAMPEDAGDDSSSASEEATLSPSETAARDLEVAGVKAAEAGDLDAAMSFFDKAVETAPERASCYNNRAQGQRIRGDVAAALEDLNKAVGLAGGKGRAACQALTQRGQLHRLQGRDEEARKDFEAAAGLGSAFAQTQLVAMNPYAAMCNKMLQDVIGKLNRGQPEDLPDPGDAA